MKIGINYLKLLDQQNIQGVKLALGAKEDDIIQEFGMNIVQKIENVLKPFEILSLESADINTLQELDGEVNIDHERAIEIEEDSEDSIKENEYLSSDFVFDESQNRVIMKIDEAAFEVKTLNGKIESIVIKDSSIKQRILDVLGVTEDIVLIREDLEGDFLIRYVDINGKVCEIGE